MTEFLVELYCSRHDAEAAAAHGERTSAAADAPTRGGTRVRLVRSLFVPEDETCFLILEAPSADVVRAVMARAGLAEGEVHEAASSDARRTGSSRYPDHDTADGGS